MSIGSVLLVALFVPAAAVGLQDTYLFDEAKIMVEQQPMKMAAVEALYETESFAPFSLTTVGTLDGSEPVF